MKTRITLLAALVAAATAAGAANVRKNFRVEHTFPLRAGGALVLENPIGDIEITGADVTGVETVAVKTVVAVNASAIEEGRQLTALIVGGDDKTRVLRAAIPAIRSKAWSSSVTWRVKVPRSTHIRVFSDSSNRVRIANVTGNVIVKNVNGEVVLENVPATVRVESVNGNIIYSTPQPAGNATLSTINGHVSVRVRPDAEFRFVGEAIRGDILTTLQPRGSFVNTAFRGSVNAPGGPTISAGTLMGNIELVAIGAQTSNPVSLKKKFLGPAPVPVRNVSAPQRAAVSEVRLPLVNQSYRHATNLGNVRIQEIRGDADIFTGAGEVQLGLVLGGLKVRSHGGPLQIGEVGGQILATTRAGDITVEAARRGGEIATQGGTVRLNYAGGPTRLVSGGGDITVRQAAGPIDALTSSGDVFITLAADSTSERIKATSEKGNVVVHVPARFGADVTATILTADPNAHTIVSDLPGLSISREQAGNKTRIRATGKINGGGQPLELDATDGGIRISTGPAR